MFEYDVFFSYSSKDKNTVHALANRLKKDGLRLWLDEWEIQPGDSIPLKIQHGLEKSRILLMCMSPAYFESEWGKLEHYTLLFRDPTNLHRRFIPFLIENCTPPDIIAHFKYIDWRIPSNKEYKKLFASCLKKNLESPPINLNLGVQTINPRYNLDKKQTDDINMDCKYLQDTHDPETGEIIRYKCTASPGEYNPDEEDKENFCNTENFSKCTLFKKKSKRIKKIDKIDLNGLIRFIPKR